MDTREEEETGVPFDDEARIFNTRSTDYAKMLEDHWNMTRIISDTRVGLVLNLMWGPTYSYHPNAPFHLPKVYPDEKMQKMKFVFVIREPTSRAVASWRSPKSKDTRSFEQVLHDGIQQRRNLEACYDGSLSRSSKPANFVEELSTEQQLQVIDECWWQRDDTHDQTTRLFGESVEFVHAHVDQGIYVDQLRRWFNLHGRNNTFVYSAEEWAENPQQTYGRIAEFFGIQVVGVSGFKNASVYNTTIDEATQKGEEDPSTLREEPSKEIQDQLREFYRPYNEQLWKLLGRKLY
uniref:Sulfotransferase domain-containing protein n=1 Tax=Alexandrium andersonii TaxID=327968 RepID=A0A7S2H015_9DINO|mmetsp:Transcript_65997/g.148099  ORF Transcript_65997/g.148099 Transcript_65997/m.148099 type:complete len:292 (+) Transcript_65997:1-876(+)